MRLDGWLIINVIIATAGRHETPNKTFQCAEILAPACLTVLARKQAFGFLPDLSPEPGVDPCQWPTPPSQAQSCCSHRLIQAALDPRPYPVEQNQMSKGDMNELPYHAMGQSVVCSLVFEKRCAKSSHQAIPCPAGVLHCCWKGGNVSHQAFKIHPFENRSSMWSQCEDDGSNACLLI